MMAREKHLLMANMESQEHLPRQLQVPLVVHIMEAMVEHLRLQQQLLELEESRIS